MGVPPTSPIWLTSAVVAMRVLLGSQMAQGWYGVTQVMGETQVPPTSLIWSTSVVVVNMRVLLGSQMAQGWHGVTQFMGETQVPLTSPIWLISAVVVMHVSPASRMVQGLHECQQLTSCATCMVFQRGA